jgi:hypothetical protein
MIIYAMMEIFLKNGQWIFIDNFFRNLNHLIFQFQLSEINFLKLFLVIFLIISDFQCIH